MSHELVDFVIIYGRNKTYRNCLVRRIWFDRAFDRAYTVEEHFYSKGVGDDSAVLDYQGKQTLITTDLLLEGVHFDLTYVPLKHLGYKSAVVNFPTYMP